ncbi:MAG: hypothetical protein RL027_616 [Pseudomonadota bacterium]|jgi:hypothetical protein
MKFWQRYKAKRELERKLKKARFINFYGVFEIDFSLGEIKETIKLDLIAEDTYYNEYLIVIKYENFVKREFYICRGRFSATRDVYHEELLNFLNSKKYRERLNYYNQLKYGQDVSKLELASKKDTSKNEGNIINLEDYR